jgi:peptide/nickel transport system substrate-binding protein
VGVAASACAQGQPATPTQAAEATATTQAAEPTSTTKAEATATSAPAAGASEQQAPMLIEQIQAGTLPALEERLTQNPCVLQPVESVGQYGGTWRHTDLAMGLSGRQNQASLYFWNREATDVIPDVAASLEVGEGGKVYTFGLRQGLKWSGGDPFTADDLVWLYEQVWLNTDLSPNGVPGWLKAGGEPVTVEKVDDYTVRFNFAIPYGLFMLYIAFQGEGILDTPPEYMKQFHAQYANKEELDKMVADASLDTWDQLFWARNDWTQNVDKPSLRPWLLSDPPTAEVNFYGLARNPYYHKVDPEGNQLPYIDGHRWKRVETAEMVLLSAVAGEIDMQVRRVKLGDYPLLSEGADKGGFHLLMWEGLETGMVVFPNHNLINDDEVLALNTDLRWRKALSYLIDRDELNELVYLGMAGPVQGCFPDSLSAEEALWEPFQHNPDMGNQLLDELGLDKRDANGWRLLPSGNPLVITFEGYSADTDVMAGGELMVAALQKAGINCAIKGVTDDQWWDRVYSVEYQFVVYLKNNSGPLLQAVYARAYTPVQHSTYWAPEWGYWYETGGKSGKEPSGAPRDLQQLFKQVEETADANKRIELFTQIYHDYLVFFPDIIAAGRIPQPVIVTNKMHNVPETAASAWTVKTPALTNPEQYFFES